jgi:hypothetical protein
MLRGCGHRAYAIGAFLPLLHTVPILQDCNAPSFVKISHNLQSYFDRAFDYTATPTAMSLPSLAEV